MKHGISLIMALLMMATVAFGQATFNDTRKVDFKVDAAFAASQKDTTSGIVGTHSGDRFASATYITSVITTTDTIAIERTVQYRPFGATAWTTSNKDTITVTDGTLNVSELAIRNSGTDLISGISGYVRIVCFFLASGNGAGGTYSHRLYYKP